MNSIPFITAKAIANGRVELDDFSEDGRSQPEALAVAMRIKHVVRPELERPQGLEPGVVTFTLADGHMLSRTVETPLGHPSRPPNAGAAADKFRSNIAFGAPKMSIASVDALIDRLSTLDRETDVADLVVNFTPTQAYN